MDVEQEMIAEFYNNNAVALDNKFRKRRPNGRVHDIERAFWLFDKENPVVVELGCGPGREAEILLKYTKNYTGIDLSERMIELAQKKLPKTSFIIGDFAEINFPEGVDIFFAFASFLHCNQNKVFNVLNRAYNALNINGIVYISTKSCHWYEKTIKQDEMGLTPVYLYSPRWLSLLCKRFKVIYQNVENFENRDWLTMILQK